MIREIVKATSGIKEEIIKIRKPLGVFNLWCCDCSLRHEIWVEVGKKETLLYMIPDRRATKDRRRADRLEKRLKKNETQNKKREKRV